MKPLLPLQHLLVRVWKAELPIFLFDPTKKDATHHSPFVVCNSSGQPSHSAYRSCKTDPNRPVQNNLLCVLGRYYINKHFCQCPISARNPDLPDKNRHSIDNLL